MGELGRRTPKDWDHVDRHPLRMGTPQNVNTVDIVEAENLEHRLNLPTQYVEHYNQGSEGACVGFACSWLMSILNRRKYAARHLYLEAQKIDEWDDTPPGEGTSVRAAMDILRNVGHWRLVRGLTRLAMLNEGVASNKWAKTVDELRACIAAGKPFALGVNWYANFDTPVVGKNNEQWVGKGNLGNLRGGHAICGYKASDRREAFGLVNSWGKSYPRVWIPYTTVQRLLDEDGEAAVVIDRT